MTVRGVIFDVDGTLVDSNQLHALAWERAFAWLGFSIEAARVLPLIGEGGDKLVPSLVSVDAATTQTLGERSSQEFERLARERRLVAFPAAGRLLRELPSRRIKTAIATSGRRAGLQVILETSDLPELETVDVVVTDDDVKDAKPAPDLVSAACQRLEIAAGDALMIGDTPYDGEAARRAGVPFMAFFTGVHTESALRRAGAARFFSGPRELLDQLDDVLAGGAAARP
jgi:HAD superfamily hydrolase (TIGR01549 family)